MFRFSNILAATLATIGLLLPAAAQAKWLRAESEHFIVYSDSGEGELRSNVRDLEEFDRLLRRFHVAALDARIDPKLEIYMVDGIGDLRVVFPQMNQTTAGVYTAGQNGVYAVSFKPAIYGDMVMKHEYYHHFMMQNFPGGYPGWLTEGLAVYFSTAQRYHGKMVVGAAMPWQGTTLDERDWRPLDQLLATSANALNSRQSELYYAQAWLLTNYMMSDDDRRQKLAAYVTALRADGDPVATWTRVVGEAPDETQKKLRAYRQHLMDMAIPVDAKHVAEVAITPMPASSDDVLLEGQLLKNGVPEARKADTLARIRAETGKHAGDRLSDLVRARAEIELGDPAAAEPLLAHLIERDADDVEARLLQGMARIKAGDAAGIDPDRRRDLYREAGRILGPALKTHPHDYRVLFAYATSRSVEDDFPSDNMLVVLDNAVQIAPQVSDFRFAAAQALARRDRYDEAIEMLRPLISDPHGRSHEKFASDLMARFQAAKAKSAGKAAEKPKG